MRHPLLLALSCLLLLIGACEGDLALSTTNASQATPSSPPMITLPTDGGLQRSDAAFDLPDAYIPPSCVPYCTNRECGADGCGSVCGVCPSGTACNASDQCEALPPVGGDPGGGTTHTVTLYGTSWCGYCQQAKRFFQDNNVPFTDRDLDEPGVTEEAYDRVYELTGRYSVSTPTVIVDDHVMLGWSEGECRSYLDL
ncbi:MAG: glutaredoxin family protein [Sandaracinaceae bacterium]|nr:glutaredoxin family protein [Sandaracinaceae bacterium]